MRSDIIGHFKPCMTEIYLHIDARMADYIRTHPYSYTRKIVRGTGEIKMPGGRRSGHPEESGSVMFGLLRQRATMAWRAQLHAHIARLEAAQGPAAAEEEPTARAIQSHSVSRTGAFPYNP